MRPSERRLLAHAFFRLTSVQLRLRTRGFRSLAGERGPSVGRSGYPVRTDDFRRARRYAGLLETVSRHHPLPAHCLQRSLALHEWLRAEGLPSDLRIGVRKEGEALKAHAWVELSGRPVNDRSAAVAAFRPLVPSPTPGDGGPGETLRPEGTSPEKGAR
jgi:hypothetical protein